MTETTPKTSTDHLLPRPSHIYEFIPQPTDAPLPSVPPSPHAITSLHVPPDESTANPKRDSQRVSSVQFSGICEDSQ